ncbi:hypothetical protein Tco_1330575, partial [Tanacetum coccineum]
VSGKGNESRYRALSKGLKGTEDHYEEIYRIGVLHLGLSGRPASRYDMTNESFNKYVMEVDISGLHIVKPEHVLSTVANALSVRLVLFNSMVANSFAYAAAPLLPRLTRENLPDQPMDDLNLDRIWRQNTMPESFSPPLDMEERIERIKSMPGIFDFRKGRGELGSGVSKLKMSLGKAMYRALSKGLKGTEDH